MSDARGGGGCRLPDQLVEPMARAIRLQWWHMAFMVSTVVVMGSVLGQSQTMKTAWVEDMLALVPTGAFLIAAWLERKDRTARFPFGFARANGLGFFVSAAALAAVGLILLFESVATLIAAEHPAVGSVRLFGHDVWFGWPMIAAQLYSLIPPLYFGRRLLPIARALNDKLLHTDALMNKANWLTGLAGIGGVIGLGLGWWWADAVAAAIISIDIVHDGIKALRASTAELVDGAPRGLASNHVADDARALHAALDARYPGATVLMRETGREIRVEILGVRPDGDPPTLDDLWPGPPDRAWRLAQVTFSARPVDGRAPAD